MIIRPATLADIPWLIEAGSRAQQEAPHYADLPASAPEQYKRLVRLLQFPDAVCVRVVDDGTGFVCATVEPGLWFECLCVVQSLLWVDPVHRGSGRAWRLYAAAEQWARERGAIRYYAGISTEISADHEVRVGRFYQKMGFRPIGPSYVKELT